MTRFSNQQKAIIDGLMQENICKAATGIIVEYGIEKMTMDKVAEAAGVAKGTIYNYFKDKNQLLDTIGSIVFNPIFKRISKLTDSNAEALLKLEEIARILLEAFNRHKKLFILLHEGRMSGMSGKNNPLEKRIQLISIIEKIIDSGIKDGQFCTSNSLAVAEIFIGMIMSINISKITAGTERPVQEDLNTLMTIFTKGIQQKCEDAKK